MNIYIAGSSAELDRARAAHNAAREAGLEVTSKWIENIEQSGGMANPSDVPIKQRSRWATDCLRQVDAANALWMLVPLTTTPTRGAWCEAYFAFARNRPIVFSGSETAQSIFCALGVELPSDEIAIAYLRGMAYRYPTKAQRDGDLLTEPSP